MGEITWPISVLKALNELAEELNTNTVHRSELLTKLPQIRNETGTKGKTPDKTMDAVTQQLRDENKLTFVDNNGTYRLRRQVKRKNSGNHRTVQTTSVALKNQLPILNTLAIKTKVKFSMKSGTHSTRVSSGLRQNTLSNYNNTCAACGTQDSHFVEACHIIPVSVNKSIGGHSSNTIALCKVDHYLFDMHAFTIKNDLTIIKTKHALPNLKLQEWLNSLPAKVNTARRIKLSKRALKKRRDLAIQSGMFSQDDLI